MSIAPRDREALLLVQRRSFSDGFVASLDLEMQARRLTIGFYGSLGGGTQTLLGTICFFGANRIVLDNAAGTFPESVRIASLDLSYDDDSDEGRATLAGATGWTLVWAFDGLAYEEHAAVIASLADDV